MWYELDENDRLTAVSDDWDANSMAAGVPANAFNNIRYKPIWEFIAGEETQRFLRAMFFLVRTKRRSVILPYRLDGLQGNTHFRMRIEPLYNGGVLVAHNPDEATASLPELVDYAATELTRCSQCLRISVDGIWYTAEAVHDLSQHANWRVCPACKETALSAADPLRKEAVAPYARAGFSKY